MLVGGVIGFVLGVIVTLIINNNKSAVKTEVDKVAEKL